MGDRGGFFRRLKNVKYGWKRCRDLAKKGSEDPDNAPYNNADSLALAASGRFFYLFLRYMDCVLLTMRTAIRFNNHGQIVQMDGSIRPAGDC